MTVGLKGPSRNGVYGADVVDGVGGELGAEAARRLVRADCCDLAPGLSAAEIQHVEATYGFEFSADHRAFLMAGLPVASPAREGATWDEPWPDWRNGDPDDLRYRLRWPVEGVLDAVERGWWAREWNARPVAGSDAVETAKRELAQVPQLVPVYAHRFLPAGRSSYGHPVLSIWGTDIICYGDDLAAYVDREFEEEDVDVDAPGVRQQASVDFWKDFLG